MNESTAIISVEPLESLPQPTAVSDAEIEPTTSGSLLSHNAIGKMTLAFLQAEKPAKVEPIDVALVVYLLQRRALDHSVWDSQLTLSERLGCSIDSVQESLKRLDSLGWVARSKRRGYSNSMTVVLDKLPQGGAIHLKVTDSAKKLALQYQKAVSKKWARYKFPKGWLTAQFVSAQRLLDRCNGDWNLCVGVVSHAFKTPPYAAMTKKSLYHLCKPWDKIVASYQLSQGKENAQ